MDEPCFIGLEMGNLKTSPHIFVPAEESNLPFFPFEPLTGFCNTATLIAQKTPFKAEKNKIRVRKIKKTARGQEWSAIPFALLYSVHI